MVGPQMLPVKTQVSDTNPPVPLKTTDSSNPPSLYTNSAPEQQLDFKRLNSSIKAQVLHEIRPELNAYIEKIVRQLNDQEKNQKFKKKQKKLENKLNKLRVKSEKNQEKILFLNESIESQSRSQENYFSKLRFPAEGGVSSEDYHREILSPMKNIIEEKVEENIEKVREENGFATSEPQAYLSFQSSPTKAELAKLVSYSELPESNQNTINPAPPLLFNNTPPELPIYNGPPFEPNRNSVPPPSLLNYTAPDPVILQPQPSTETKIDPPQIHPPTLFEPPQPLIHEKTDSSLSIPHMPTPLLIQPPPPRPQIFGPPMVFQASSNPLNAPDHRSINVPDGSSGSLAQSEENENTEKKINPNPNSPKKITPNVTGLNLNFLNAPKSQQGVTSETDKTLESNNPEKVAQGANIPFKPAQPNIKFGPGLGPSPQMNTIFGPGTGSNLSIPPPLNLGSFQGLRPVNNFAFTPPNIYSSEAKNIPNAVNPFNSKGDVQNEVSDGALNTDFSGHAVTHLKAGPPSILGQNPIHKVQTGPTLLSPNLNKPNSLEANLQPAPISNPNFNPQGPIPALLNQNLNAPLLKTPSNPSPNIPGTNPPPPPLIQNSAINLTLPSNFPNSLGQGTNLQFTPQMNNKPILPLPNINTQGFNFLSQGGMKFPNFPLNNPLTLISNNSNPTVVDASPPPLNSSALNPPAKISSSPDQSIQGPIPNLPSQSIVNPANLPSLNTNPSGQGNNTPFPPTSYFINQAKVPNPSLIGAGIPAPNIQGVKFPLPNLGGINPSPISSDSAYSSIQNPNSVLPPAIGANTTTHNLNPPDASKFNHSAFIPPPLNLSGSYPQVPSHGFNPPFIGGIKTDSQNSGPNNDKINNPSNQGPLLMNMNQNKFPLSIPQLIPSLTPQNFIKQQGMASGNSNPSGLVKNPGPSVPMIPGLNAPNRNSGPIVPGLNAPNAVNLPNLSAPNINNLGVQDRSNNLPQIEDPKIPPPTILNQSGIANTQPFLKKPDDFGDVVQ